MKSGGAESIYFEIWGGGGAWPPGPPGSSAYVVYIVAVTIRGGGTWHNLEGPK